MAGGCSRGGRDDPHALGGAWAYGLYLATFGFTSATGVAGSLLLGLAFLYDAAQILHYGAELTKVLVTDGPQPFDDRRHPAGVDP